MNNMANEWMLEAIWDEERAAKAQKEGNTISAAFYTKYAKEARANEAACRANGE